MTRRLGVLDSQPPFCYNQIPMLDKILPKINKTYASSISLIIISIAVALFRVMPHPPNITPITALALVGGLTFPRARFAVISCFLALFISDAFIGFHHLMVFVYGSFFLTILVGLFIKTYLSKRYLFPGAVLSSCLFFLITNFGVWLYSPAYPKTVTGLYHCYVAGVPFFRYSIIGDLAFTLIIATSIHLITALVKKSSLFIKNPV